ncbi:MAG: sialidase family protein [Acidobacteriota bacterium]|nr:glycoside hydrolase [Blastocatellia bacterium]MDW8412219.1 sialidase family protein [Acidobacteriota bacterium]
MNRVFLLAALISLSTTALSSGSYLNVRPSDKLRLRYWQAMAKAEDLHKNYAWVLTSEAERHVSVSAHRYLSLLHSLLSEDSSSTELQAVLPPSNRNRLVNNFDVSGTAQQQSSSAASENNIVILYNDYESATAVVAYSLDGGISWQQSSIPSIRGGINIGEGNVTVSRQRTFFAATMAINTLDESTIAVSKSTDGGRSWSVATDGVVNTSPNFFHDKPWIAVDETGQNVFLAWIRFETSQNRIMFNRSTDAGRSFLRPIELTPSTKGFSVGSVRVAASAGRIYVSWFDSSDNSIRLVRSTDGGRTFGNIQTAIRLGRRVLPTMLNGSVLTETVASLAIAPNGNVYLCFSAKPSETSVDHSDVFIIRSTDGGETFSTATRVNDDATITAQFRPSIAVTSSGALVAQWYDRRNDQANNALTGIYAAVSTDGGATFSRNTLISDHVWPFAPTPRGVRFGSHGDYDQISTDGEAVYFHWTDYRNGRDSNIYFATARSDKLLDPGFTLGARTIAAEIVGTQAKFFLESSTLAGNPRSVLKLDATSSINPVFLFSAHQVPTGSSFELLVTLREDRVRPGTYPIIITATDIRSGITQSLTVRLVLLQDPVKVAKVQITENAGNSSSPKLVLDSSGILHLCWQDDKDGPQQIYYSRSIDGTDFSPTVNVSHSYQDATRPRIAVDARGGVHIVWQERYDLGSVIVYSSSQDGRTFNAKRVISTGEFVNDANICVGTDDSINIVWSEEQLNMSRLMLSRSFDAGRSFTQPQIIRSSSRQVLFEPVVEVKNGIIHLAYTFLTVTGERFGNPIFTASVHYTRSSDSGKTFSEPFQIVPSINLSDSPVMKVTDDGQVILMYAGLDNRLPFPSREIYLARSFDNGLSFATPQLIAFGNGDSTKVDAAFDPAGNIVAVWRDTQDLNYEIYLSRLFVGETAFTGPINISQNLGVSEHPALAIDRQGNITIVWQDDTNGSNELFSRRLTADNFPTPMIEDFEPKLAAIGDNFVIRGKNLAGVTEVKVGQLSARIFRKSATGIEAQVPSGAATGRILAVSPTGISRSNSDLQIKGRIGVSNTRVSFPATGTASSSETQISIINNSSLTRQVRISSNNPSFIVSVAVINLAPAQEVPIKLTFKPQRAGLIVGGILLQADESTMLPLQPVLVTLSGVGLDEERPRISLLSPRGGEKLVAGQTAQIIWQAQDNTAIALQELLFSSDGGRNYVSIARPEGVRSYLWQVPATKTRRARIQLIVTDVAGNKSSVESGDFTISFK